MWLQKWKGKAASPGVVTGVAFVFRSETQLPSFPGYVLIAHTTDPSLVTLLINACAIVTDIGGMVCHAASIAREFGIPCVVSTETASKIICTGDIVEVDGTVGEVKLISRIYEK